MPTAMWGPTREVSRTPAPAQQGGRLSAPAPQKAPAMQLARDADGRERVHAEKEQVRAEIEREEACQVQLREEIHILQAKLSRSREFVACRQEQQGSLDQLLIEAHAP